MEIGIYRSHRSLLLCIYIYIIKSGVSTQNSIPLSFQFNSISTLKFLSLLLSLSLSDSERCRFSGSFSSTAYWFLERSNSQLIQTVGVFSTATGKVTAFWISLSLTLWFWTPLPFPCHVFVFWFFERSIYFWVLFGLNFKKKFGIPIRFVFFEVLWVGNRVRRWLVSLTILLFSCSLLSVSICCRSAQLVELHCFERSELGMSQSVSVEVKRVCVWCFYFLFGFWENRGIWNGVMFENFPISVFFFFSSVGPQFGF
jgi:hypothetical protein